MPFCTNCGKQVKDQHKFCASCGMPVESENAAPPPAAPVPIPQPATPAPAPVVRNTSPSNTVAQNTAPSVQGESIRIIIPNNYLIVTERRTIFAKLTNEIANEAVKMRRSGAESEGKGFFGKWAAQMKGMNNYSDRYIKYTPEQLLNETQGNFALDNSMVRKIKVQDNTDDEGGAAEYGIEIETAANKLKFKAGYDPSDYFKQAYGPIVK
jgi:hypothetical protein